MRKINDEKGVALRALGFYKNVPKKNNEMVREEIEGAEVRCFFEITSQSDGNVAEVEVAPLAVLAALAAGASGPEWN